MQGHEEYAQPWTRSSSHTAALLNYHRISSTTFGEFDFRSLAALSTTEPSTHERCGKNSISARKGEVHRAMLFLQSSHCYHTNLSKCFLSLSFPCHLVKYLATKLVSLIISLLLCHSLGLKLAVTFDAYSSPPESEPPYLPNILSTPLCSLLLL